MAEYIDKHKAYLLLKDLEAAYIYPPVKEAYGTAARRIDQIKTADVQPLSVFAEHIKNRLYETAFNTDEPIASHAIEDMAERIDFWVAELKDGDKQ